MLEDSIVAGLREVISRAAVSLSRDVVSALKAAREREDSFLAREILNSILKNIEEAERRGLPLCQDTGTPTFFVHLGDGFPVRSRLGDLIARAVRESTPSVPLRPNTVDPWTGRNSGDNTGRGVPVIRWFPVEGDELRVIYLAKGGGSENVSRLFMLNPTEGVEGIRRAVLRAAIDAGGKPCPPVILGVGVGGGADAALEAAKAATLRRVGSRSGDPAVAELEERLLEDVNSLGIGPMGLGGRTYALDVHVDWMHRHPASLPVAVSMLCWAARRGEVVFHPDGSYEVLEPG